MRGHHMSRKPFGKGWGSVREADGLAGGDFLRYSSRIGLAMELPQQEIASRIARLLGVAAQADLAGVVVFGRSFYDRPGPVGYLTGFLPPFPSSADAPGVSGLGQVALVLQGAAKPLIITDRFVRPFDHALFDVTATADVAGAVVAAVGRRGGALWGTAGSDIVPFDLFARVREGLASVRWQSLDRELHALRRHKSPEDVLGLRRAAEVAAAGFEAAIGAIRAGVRERDVAAAGMGAAIAAGADFVRYLRVHTGAASAVGSRWPPATDTRIAAGDLVSMDFVGAAGGYGFDLARTVLVRPAPEKAHQLLEDAHTVEAAALAVVRAGQTVEGLIAEIRRAADATRSGEYLSGFFGHGIGLETLEWPYLMPGQTGGLVAGEVLCIEPGLRCPGFGGAEVEDEVLVTESGCELLSPFRREPILV